jgi:hypothetical protein
VSKGTVSFEDAYSIQETEKALCVDCPDFHHPLWIPKSQIHDDSEVWKNGQDGTLVITEWFAEERGLI